MSFLGVVFGKVIKDLRKERKISQADFAKSMGVEPPTASRWETGQSLPVNDRIDSILTVLGIKAEDFIARMSMGGEGTSQTHMAQTIARQQAQIDELKQNASPSLSEVESSVVEALRQLPREEFLAMAFGVTGNLEYLREAMSIAAAADRKAIELLANQHRNLNRKAASQK